MGRGSSKAGGGGGGGMLDKNTSVSVKSSHPLTDAIPKGGGGFANEIMNTRDAFEREYGSVIKNLNLSLASFNQKDVLGAYGDNTLYMNETYSKNKNLTSAMQSAARNGFHPNIGNRTGAEAVAAHELGHRLGEMAAKKAGIDQAEIVKRAGQKIRLKQASLGSNISKYATYNYLETIAEASADVFCNGTKAAKASRAIMAEIKAILG